jgi:hypothetical protein
MMPTSTRSHGSGGSGSRSVSTVEKAATGDFRKVYEDRQVEVLSAADIAKQFLEMEGGMKQAVAAAAARESQLLTAIQYLQEEAKRVKELCEVTAATKEAAGTERPISMATQEADTASKLVVETWEAGKVALKETKASGATEERVEIEDAAVASSLQRMGEGDTSTVLRHLVQQMALLQQQFNSQNKASTRRAPQQPIIEEQSTTTTMGKDDKRDKV